MRHLRSLISIHRQIQRIAFHINSIACSIRYINNNTQNVCFIDTPFYICYLRRLSNRA